MKDTKETHIRTLVRMAFPIVFFFRSCSFFIFCSFSEEWFPIHCLFPFEGINRWSGAYLFDFPFESLLVGTSFWSWKHRFGFNRVGCQRTHMRDTIQKVFPSCQSSRDLRSSCLKALKMDQKYNKKILLCLLTICSKHVNFWWSLTLLSSMNVWSRPR